MWMESYDCDLRRRFDIQDQIAGEIVSSLQLALTEGEQAQLWRRGTESGKAWEQFQRGHDFEGRYTREGHRRAILHYREALVIDPNYLSAMVSLAFCRLDEIRLGWTADPGDATSEAEQLCTKAMSFRPHPDVQALLAFLRFFQKRWDEAEAAMEIAVELGSHSPEIIGYQGALNDLMGDYAAAIRAYTRALSLSAHSPAWIASNLGLTYLAVGDNDEAERIFREVVQFHPNYVRAWIGLAVALVRQGKTSEAKHAAELVLSLDPHFTTQEWARSEPFREAHLLSRFVVDMRATGLP
jgi:tetratricopeptide (TPR) repeat protein